MSQNSPFTLLYLIFLWHNVLTISLTLHDILWSSIIYITNYIGSCVANEAMLTGESVPQIKESLALVDRELITDIKSGKPMQVLLWWWYVICCILLEIQFSWLPTMNELFDFPIFFDFVFYLVNFQRRTSHPFSFMETSTTLRNMFDV